MFGGNTRLPFVLALQTDVQPLLMTAILLFVLYRTTYLVWRQTEGCMVDIAVISPC